MKKSLIALAVAGAFAAPAFAATSNVDMYGVITLGIDFMDTDAAAPADSDLTALNSYASRFGFKGTEDLGGGLKAVWQIEAQTNADGGAAAGGVGAAVAGGALDSAMRNTFVGVAGSFGTVLVGKHDSPYKLATGKLDMFADTAGDYNNIVGNVNGANAFDLRFNNVVAYVSPTFSGFHAAAAYVFGQEVSNGATPDFDGYALMGMYENGPLFASLAYETHNNYATVGGAGRDRDSWKLGLGYSFGDAKVGLVYEDADDSVGATATDRSAWWIGGSYTMGPIELKLAYGNANDGDTAADTSADAWSLGADYNMSKRTKVGVVYTNTDNDAGGTYGALNGSNNAIAPAAGRDPSAWSLYVRHSF